MNALRIAAASVLLAVSGPAFAQSSQRLGPSKVGTAYPKGSRVYATGARASSTYGRGYTAREATGAPNVFPRFGDRKGAWTCKTKTSTSDWLEVTFPSTQAKALVVFETWKPGAITKIVIGERVVFQPGKLKRYREAQALCVEFGAPLTVDTVRIEVSAARVGYYPEIDAVALIPASGAPRGGEAPAEPAPAASGDEEPKLAEARALFDEVEAAIPSLQGGDSAGANALLGKVKQATELLKQCTNQRADAWRVQARRTRTLDGAVRNQYAKRPAKPAGGSAATLDASTRRAIQILDAVEEAATRLRPGAPIGNFLSKITDARRSLSFSRQQETAGWKQASKRADDLEARCRKIGAMKPEPKPKVKVKPKPKWQPKPLGKPAPQGKLGGFDASAPAVGKGSILSPEEFSARTKAETFTYATEAEASTQYSAKEHPATAATGPPNAYPKHANNVLAWAPLRGHSPQDWLEVGFPKTTTRCIYVYESYSTGGIRLITDGKSVLYRWVKPTPKPKPEPKKQRYTYTQPAEAQVLCVELPEPRSIERLRIVVHPSEVKGWPQIDAVALGPRGLGEWDGVWRQPLGPNDERTFSGLRSNLKWGKGRLAKRKGTILDPKTGELEFMDIVTSSREGVASMEKKRHEKVLAFLKEVDAFEQEVQRRGAESRAKLAALGPNAKARAEAIVEEVQENYDEVSRNRPSRLVPSFPKEKTPATLKAYGVALKKATDRLRQWKVILAEANVWVPGFRQGQTIPRINYELKRVKDPVKGYREDAADRLSFDPRSVGDKELRFAAWRREETELVQKLTKAIDRGALVAAFETGYLGKPSDEAASVLRDLRSRRAALLKFIDAQVAKERLPEHKGGDARLIKIARGLLKDRAGPYMGISDPLTTKEGVWTSRDLVSSEDHGSYTKKTYRVLNSPYRYERFWVSVAKKDPERPGYVRVDDYGIKYYHQGGKPLGKWHVYQSMRAYLMLEKNLPK